MPCPPLPGADVEHVLAHTPGVWEELRGGRLFLTGGTGFFGAWLLESFVRANERFGLQATACVLTRRPGVFARTAPHLASRADVCLVEGDVRNFNFPEGRFSWVIHAATESGTDQGATAPLAQLETIVEGTRRVLEFAARAGARKLLFTSSGAVYGRQPPELAQVPEDYSGGPDPLDPRSAYGEGKRLAEQWCVLFGGAHGIEVKIARCFAFVGPRLSLDAHFAIGNFIRDGLAGGPIRVRGDGTPYRSYLYAADLAIWLWTVLARGAPGAAYNVGSDRPLTIAQVAAEVGAAFGGQIEIQLAESPVPGRPASRYVPDVRRARDQLGLVSRVALIDAIRKTAAWHGK